MVFGRLLLSRFLVGLSRRTRLTNFLLGNFDHLVEASQLGYNPNNYSIFRDVFGKKKSKRHSWLLIFFIRWVLNNWSKRLLLHYRWLCKLFLGMVLFNVPEVKMTIIDQRAYRRFPWWKSSITYLKINCRCPEKLGRVYCCRPDASRIFIVLTDKVKSDHVLPSVSGGNYLPYNIRGSSDTNSSKPAPSLKRGSLAVYEVVKNWMRNQSFEKHLNFLLCAWKYLVNSGFISPITCISYKNDFQEVMQDDSKSAVGV